MGRKNKRTLLREKLEHSLLRQLENMGANVVFFENLVQDYLKLWDIKEMLQKDIEKRGVGQKEPNSKGDMIWKSNPSIKELTGVNRQMLTILRELGLTADSVDIGVEGCDEESGYGDDAAL